MKRRSQKHAEADLALRLSCEFHHPEATVAALLAAVTGTPIDFVLLVASTEESAALTEPALGRCRELELLPEALLSQVSDHVRALREAAVVANSLLRERGLPTPDNLGLQLFAMAADPERGEPGALAAGNLMTVLFARARELQPQVDLHARKVCDGRSCLQAYEDAMHGYARLATGR